MTMYIDPNHWRTQNPFNSPRSQNPPGPSPPALKNTAQPQKASRDRVIHKFYHVIRPWSLPSHVHILTKYFSHPLAHHLDHHSPHPKTLGLEKHRIHDLMTISFSSFPIRPSRFTRPTLLVSPSSPDISVSLSFPNFPTNFPFRLPFLHSRFHGIRVQEIEIKTISLRVSNRIRYSETLSFWFSAVWQRFCFQIPFFSATAPAQEVVLMEVARLPELDSVNPSSFFLNWGFPVLWANSRQFEIGLVGDFRFCEVIQDSWDCLLLVWFENPISATSSVAVRAQGEFF